MRWRRTQSGDPPYHTPVFVRDKEIGDPELEPVTVVASPAVTHVKYRVVR
ncbi:MAG: hypothetical protein ACRDPC_05600 [Solirubrobacteraceae bacterium]